MGQKAGCADKFYDKFSESHFPTYGVHFRVQVFPFDRPLSMTVVLTAK